MNRKEWIEAHELNWKDSLKLMPSNRTFFQEQALTQLQNALKSASIEFRLQESLVDDFTSVHPSNQLIRTIFNHDCVSDCFIYFNQIDLTVKKKTFHFEYSGYFDPDSLLKAFLKSLKNEIESCS